LRLRSISLKEVGLKEFKALLAKLISIPSPSGSESLLAHFIHGYLEGLGVQVRLVETQGYGPSITAALNFSRKGKTLLFYGHLDTVEPSPGWRGNPYHPRFREGKVYGLGACDMKAGLAGLLLAIQRLSGMEGLEGSVRLALTSGEEKSVKGFEALKASGAFRNVDAAISAEPTGLRRLETGKLGKAVFKVEFKGENSPREASHFTLQLAEGFKVLAVETFSTFNSKPDRCVVAVERSLVLGESLNKVFEELEALALKAGRARLSFFREALPPVEAYRVEAGNPLVKALEEACLKVLTFKPKLVMGEAGIENLLALNCGIPTLVYGAEGGGMHGAEEYVYLDSGVKAANVYLEAAIKFLSFRSR